MDDVYSPIDEQIESAAVSHAFGLLAAAGDAKLAKVRLEQIVAATKEYAAQRSAAEKIVAEAAKAQAALEAREAALVKREEACAAAEVEYFRQQPRDRFPHGSNFEPGSVSHSGLAREAYHE